MSATVRRLSRATVIDLCAELEVDPNEVAQITITGTDVRIELLGVVERSSSSQAGLASFVTGGVL